MEDITPGLLKRIQENFQEQFDKSKVISDLYAKVRDGTATYAEANVFAIEVGNILAGTYKRNISSDVLPDGKMYYNIAQRIINSTMTNNFFLITDVTNQVQQSLNEAAHIGIKPITPELNQDRIDGIVNRVSDEDIYDDVAWILDEPIINFSQSIVDDAIRENAEFHASAGMSPKIVRKLAGGCCDWCRALAGTYRYPDGVPEDLYRRHRYCRCTVEYYPGDGSRQNSHTKQWRNEKERDKIEERKSVGIKPQATETPAEKEKRIEKENGMEFADKIAAHPKMLQAYTPEGLKVSLERSGYEVKTLSKGKYKGVTFEDGGGFKVNFGGDGILQYHPEKGSHHGGAYYKISTGKGGTKHYELDGTEKKD